MRGLPLRMRSLSRVLVAFVSFLLDSAPFTASEMPLGFMARSGLIDSLMFAEADPPHPPPPQPNTFAQFAPFVA
jgi:hypothetical protein